MLWPKNTFRLICVMNTCPSPSYNPLLSRNAMFCHTPCLCKTVSCSLNTCLTHCVYLANSYSSFNTLIPYLPNPKSWSLPPHVQNHSPKHAAVYYLLTYMLTCRSRAEVATCPSLYPSAFKVWDRINLKTYLERGRGKGRQRNI